MVFIGKHQKQPCKRPFQVMQTVEPWTSRATAGTVRSIHLLFFFDNREARGVQVEEIGENSDLWVGFLIATTVSPKFWGCSPVAHLNHLYCNWNCTTAQELDAPGARCAEGSVFMACSEIGRFLKMGEPKTIPKLVM